jgi:hypothetical protein
MENRDSEREKGTGETAPKSSRHSALLSQIHLGERIEAQPHGSPVRYSVWLDRCSEAASLLSV